MRGTPPMVTWALALAATGAAHALRGSVGTQLPPGNRAGTRPNVVILFLDDWAWGDLGSNGAGAETPHMDALAASGMRFTDAHAMSVCTPSRASLLTGRLGLRTGVVANFAADALFGLPLTELTLGDVATSAGYDTKVVGKWHLGHAPGYHPTFRGFDEYLGVPYSIDMGCVNSPSVNLPPDEPCAFDPSGDPTGGLPGVPLYDARARNCSGRAGCNGLIVEQPADLTTLTDRYADAAVEFIARHATGGAPPRPRPFLLYVPFSHTHVPLAHAPRWANASRARTLFADTLLELDAAVGRVVAALAAHGVANDTLVLLAGDNGPWNVKCALAGSQGPFTGSYQAALGGGATGKMTTWEGGHRVAALAAWPGAVPAGAVSAATISVLDVLPTFAALAGVALPRDRSFDGVDLSPVLFAGAAGVREVLFHPDTLTGNITAVRWRNYKAYFESASYFGCDEWGALPRAHDPPLVFDVDADPAEGAPLAEPPPGVVDAVRAAFAEKWRDVTATFRSTADYAGGGRPAWPCCNAANVACRCTN